jgi:molybdopterin-guanine dinucleotide biosynthesis protein MobB
MKRYPPLIGFAAWSGSGKTTLLEQIIPLLRAADLHLALVKHSHHDFAIDTPGKDSHRLRMAGAGQMILASSQRTVLIREEPPPHIDADLASLLTLIEPDRCDLILVEGFRHLAIPKIEIHRPALGKPLLARSDPHIIAIACDTPLATPLPRLDLNQPHTVAQFILTWLPGAPSASALFAAPHSL